MSLFDARSRRTSRTSLCGAVVVIAACIGAAGCGFQPLYAERTDGTSTVDALDGLKVAPIKGRVGQQLRNQLIFLAGGGEEPINPIYRLDIALRQSARSILVQVDGEASGRLLVLRANYRLTDLATKTEIAKGSGAAQAAFEKFDEVYANQRAQRDAENRAAKELARSIHTRVSAILDRGGQ